MVTRTNTDEDITKRGDLLRNDSVHGSFPGTVIEDFKEQSADRERPYRPHDRRERSASIDYTSYGIHDALVIDNTGVVRDREGLGKHLLAKVSVKCC